MITILEAVSIAHRIDFNQGHIPETKVYLYKNIYGKNQLNMLDSDSDDFMFWMDARWLLSKKTYLKKFGLIIMFDKKNLDDGYETWLNEVTEL